MIVVFLPMVMWLIFIGGIFFIVALATDLFRILVWIIEQVCKVLIVVFFVSRHLIELVRIKFTKPRPPNNLLEMKYNYRRKRWE